MAEEESLVFKLENLNLREHPGCPLKRTEYVLALVELVNHPQSRIYLDLYNT